MRKRIDYFDYLRILATYAVVVLHIAAEHFNYVDINTFRWQALNLYDGISRWAVPVFVMMSGALFLDGKGKGIRILYKKYIFRIVIAFCFWSLVYAFIEKAVYEETWSEFFLEFLSGHYHMWFLFMIVGLYMMVPLLRKIIEDEKLVLYLLILFVGCVAIIPFIIIIISLFDNEIASVLKQVLVHTRTPFNMEYVGYFVLGYYLNNVQIDSKKKRWTICGMGIVGFVATVLLTAVGSQMKGMAIAEFYKNLNINVLLEAMAIFVFVRYNLNKLPENKVMKKLVQVLSKYSFGAYLIHIIIVEDWSRHGFTALSFQPWISIPVLSVAVFLLSYVVAIILSKIPVLGEYIV